MRAAFVAAESCWASPFSESAWSEIPRITSQFWAAPEAAWDNLGGDDIAAVNDRLSGLPSAERDSDEEAKRFDLLMLRAQLCVVNAEPGFTTIRDHVRELASDLLAQTRIPAVREQAAFLEALAEEHWWDDVTLPMLDEARRRVRGLVRLIEKHKRNKVYTDFPDEPGELTELPSLTGSGQVNGERFRAKVREFLRRHEDHIAIHKLRRNVALTTSDLAELERILVESGEFDQETLSRAAAPSGRPGPVRAVAHRPRPRCRRRRTVRVRAGHSTALEPDRVPRPGRGVPHPPRCGVPRAALRVPIQRDRTQRSRCDLPRPVRRTGDHARRRSSTSLGLMIDR